MMSQSHSYQSVSVFAPISIGNVSVGFDLLGLAVKPIDHQLLGDIVRIEQSTDDTLKCLGKFVSSLPTKKQENIVWQCMLAFNQRLIQDEKSPVSVYITLEKNIPVCSGLGSSACSVVAALFALNEFYLKPYTNHQLLQMMGEQEAKISGSLHYDNVAPCFLGGLQLMLEDTNKMTQEIPMIKDIYWLIAYPNIEVSTRLAREILPEKYDRKTLVTFAQRLAGFIDACYRQDKIQAFAFFDDVVAEPYRTRLLEKYAKTKRALQQCGALAVGISGSGPTLFAACDNLELAKKLQGIVDTQYINSEVGFSAICIADDKGARQLLD
jgi:homoserine kinase